MSSPQECGETGEIHRLGSAPDPTPRERPRRTGSRSSRHCSPTGCRDAIGRMIWLVRRAEPPLRRRVAADAKGAVDRARRSSRSRAGPAPHASAPRCGEQPPPCMHPHLSFPLQQAHRRASDWRVLELIDDFPRHRDHTDTGLRFVFPHTETRNNRLLRGMRCRYHEAEAAFAVAHVEGAGGGAGLGQAEVFGAGETVRELEIVKFALTLVGHGGRAADL